MPDGVKDPDELIQTNPELWVEHVKNADDATSWTLKHYEHQYDKSTAEGKRHLSTKALAVIKGLQDPVEREHHLKNLAKNLDVSLVSLMDKLQQTKIKPQQKKTSKAEVISPDLTSYEDDFLALNAMFPDVRDSLKLLKDHTLSSQPREAFKQQLLQHAANMRLDSETVSALNELEDYVKILLLTAEEKYASWTPADIMAETMALARRIVTKSKSESKSELTVEIAEAEKSGDFKRAAELLDQYQQLLKKG